MSEVLVVYGTTHGQTAKIAETLAIHMRRDGCRVYVCDASRISPEIRSEQFDGVIILASVHARGYQRAVKRWVERNVDQLNRMPSGFVSVCLGILEQRPEAQREVWEILDRFLDTTGWNPEVRKIVAGALPYTRYNWFTRWLMRRIVAKAGGDTDTSRDYEYTDWNQVRQLAHDFSRRCGEWEIARPVRSTGAKVVI
jgi:menaquinone-dependent protoporphyrinogen oxidase